MTLTSPAPGSDWYSVLGLSPAASADEIAVAVERLSRQASALAVTAPERSQQLREVTRAIKRDLLSGLEGRRRYDQSLRPGAAAAQAPAAPPGMLPAGPPAAPAAGPPAAHPVKPSAAPTVKPSAAPPVKPSAAATVKPSAAPPVKPSAAATVKPSAAPPAAPATGPPAAPPATSTAAPAAGHPAPAAGATAPPAPDRRKRFMRFLQGAWTCPACGHDAMPGEEFCTKCGGKLRTATGDDAPAVPGSGGARAPSCAACGIALSPTDRFCTHCGSRRQ
jgi:curved DNA-binding protein CbpA